MVRNIYIVVKTFETTEFVPKPNKRKKRLTPSFTLLLWPYFLQVIL